jgi:hypothetical protein
MIRKAFLRGEKNILSHLLILLFAALVQYDSPAIGGGAEYNLCESSCPSFHYSFEDMIELIPIDFGGESIQGAIYKDSNGNFYFRIEIYTPIFEGVAIIKMTNENYHVIFTYHVHSDTRGPINGPDAFICQKIRESNIYFSCYQNLSDENDIARRLAHDTLSIITQRISKISKSSELFSLTKPSSGRTKGSRR